jgi:hypothetical protein
MSTTSAAQPAPASFDSVVLIPYYLEKWTMLDGSDSLSQLHAKFRGESTFVDKEEAWRVGNQQSTSSSNPIANGGEDYDTNESEDIKTGYVLDVLKDIVIDSEQIWVRVSVFVMNEISVSSQII